MHLILKLELYIEGCTVITHCPRTLICWTARSSKVNLGWLFHTSRAWVILIELLDALFYARESWQECVRIKPSGAVPTTNR